MPLEDLENKEKNQERKNNYGIYLLISVFLSYIFNVIPNNNEPHTLSSGLAFLVSFSTTIIPQILDIAVVYFLVLWIIDLIRRRGGIERSENKNTKLVVNIIFAIPLLIMFASILITFLKR